MNTPAPQTADGVPELTIDERLLISRRRTGLDTTEFAERTGMSRATVNNYESAKYQRRRKPIYLKAWALGAGVSYTWLTTGRPPGPEGVPDQHLGGFACTNPPAGSEQAQLATVTQLQPQAA